MLEFQLNDKPFIVANSFTPGLKIADWFALASEEAIFSMDSSYLGGNVPFNGTDVIGDRLVARYSRR